MKLEGTADFPYGAAEVSNVQHDAIQHQVVLRDHDEGKDRQPTVRGPCRLWSDRRQLDGALMGLYYGGGGLIARNRGR